MGDPLICGSHLRTCRPIIHVILVCNYFTYFISLLGDFAILLSSGMKWYVALMYNTLSAITAIIGMFIGVAIGNASDESTAWILAITAGVFLYVALVDLVCFSHISQEVHLWVILVINTYPQLCFGHE